MYMKGGGVMIDGYINKYGKRLYGLCLTLCADKPEADDLYQDTWLKVLEKIHKYNSQKDFEPWLTKICVNIFRNRLRRLARSPFLNSFSTSSQKDSFIESFSAPVIKSYESLHEAVSNLPQKLKITVILFYFNDMEILRVSDTLSIPPGTVKSRLNKARALLKEALKDETDIQL